MSTLTKALKADFETLPAKTMGDISMRMANLDKLTAMKVTAKPGASWSKDLKEAAGTDSCQKWHVGYMLSGTLAVKMDTGQEEHATAGTVFVCPPGHDAWCVGDEPAVFVEWSCGSEEFQK